MRAVRLAAPGRLQVEEIAVPSAGPGELLLRMEACGICGTDRHIVRGEYPSALPVTLGHEFAGVIVASDSTAPAALASTLDGVAPSPMGDGAAREGGAPPVGTRVAVDPNIACSVCRDCRRGDPCLCPRRVALGVDLDGGLAEYVRVPLRQVYALPPGVPAAWGALCEPLACCLHGLDLAAIRPGMSVVVVGGGVIGQLMVQLARLAGATSVILSTRQAARRRLAEELGATATIDPQSSNPVDAVAGAAGLLPGGADAVLECAGTTETFEQAVGLARRGGTVLIFGVAPQGARAGISPFDVFARELRIVGAYLNPHTHGRAVELVASGRLALAPLVTHQLSLDDVPAALLAAPTPGEVKAMVNGVTSG